MAEQAGTMQWSTAHVAPGDRFAYWREALSANLIGITPEAAPEDRENFAGGITRMPIGDTGVMTLDMTLSRLRTERSAADIRSMPGDGVFLYRASSAGMNFQFHDRNGFSPQPGVTVMGGLDRERFSEALTPGRYRCEVLRIPSAAFGGVVDAPARLDPREIDMATGPSALLHGFFGSFLQELPRLTGHERADALATLTSLAILSLRRDKAGDEPVREAVRIARLRKIQDYVGRHAGDPNLSPSTAAKALQLSVRQLHALLEPSGTTFSRLLNEQRIHLAARYLNTGTRHTVSEIAFQSGFLSLPTFYRAFRAITGMSPQKMRATGAKDSGRASDVNH